MSASQITKCRASRVSFVLAAAFTATVVGANLAPVAGAQGPTANTARSQSLNETAQLRVLNRHGIIFNEEGPAAGTFKCTLTLRLTAKVTHVSIQFSANPSGGDLRGEGTANVQAEGPIGRVSGTVAVTGGTGRYAHAHGSGLKITGTVNRHNYNLSIRVSGTMYY